MTLDLPDEPRILVVQTAFLGDVVLATPLLSALREKFPRSRLSFMGTPAGVAIIQGHPALDDAITYDKRADDKGLAGLRRKAAEVAAEKFDLAIGAHRSLRTAGLLALSGIKERIGFATSALPWVYRHRVPWDIETHEIDRDLGLLAPLGGPPEGFVPAPSLAPIEPAGEELLGPDIAGLKIGLCPGSVWPTKRWPALGFSVLAEDLCLNQGARIFLIGSADDREVAAEVEAYAECEVENLVGRTSLREWTRVIAAMDIVVTNDSAPTHIAAALGVPAVTVFGPTLPAMGFAPRGPRTRSVEISGLACRPCGRHGAKSCPEGHFKCMRLIEPDYVSAACRAVLAEGQ